MKRRPPYARRFAVHQKKRAERFARSPRPTDVVRLQRVVKVAPPAPITLAGLRRLSVVPYAFF